MISVIKIVEDTTVDGPGFRTTVYAAGCPNACPGCHNPQSWNKSAGTMMDVDDIFKIIQADDFADVTFSGGDPMFQPEGFARLARRIKKETDKNIWCYTGYTFEKLLQNDKQKELLQWIDVLVDGPFIEKQKDPDLRFRGSKNQRLIDVPRSLNNGHVELYHNNML